MGLKNNRNPGYEVGYGKPPIHSRFRKGQSGNPGGRKKTSKPAFQGVGLSAEHEAILRVMRENVCIETDGHEKSVARHEQIFRMLCQLAAQGDVRAAKMVKEAYEEATRAEFEKGRLAEEASGLEREMLWELTRKMREAARKEGGSNLGSADTAPDGEPGPEATSASSSNEVAARSQAEDLPPHHTGEGVNETTAPGALVTASGATVSDGRSSEICTQEREEEAIRSPLSRDPVPPPKTWLNETETLAPGFSRSSSRRRWGEPLIRDERPMTATHY